MALALATPGRPTSGCCAATPTESSEGLASKQGTAHGLTTATAWPRLLRLLPTLDIVATAPDSDCDEFYRVATATVAHALCDRDGVPVPKWIRNCVLDQDSIVVRHVSPSGRYGRLIVENAPRICRIHRLYFESDWLAAT